MSWSANDVFLFCIDKLFVLLMLLLCTLFRELFSFLLLCHLTATALITLAWSCACFLTSSSVAVVCCWRDGWVASAVPVTWNLQTWICKKKGCKKRTLDVTLFFFLFFFFKYIVNSLTNVFFLPPLSPKCLFKESGRMNNTWSAVDCHSV